MTSGEYQTGMSNFRWSGRRVRWYEARVRIGLAGSECERRCAIEMRRAAAQL